MKTKPVQAEPRPIVMLTTDELARLVRDAVRTELAAVEHTPAAEVLTREQAAELLQVHPVMVSRYVQREGLPTVKLGPLYRFRRGEVLAWMERRKAVGA